MLYIDNTYVYIHTYVFNTYVKLCAFILKQGFHHLTRVPICLTSQLFYYWERLFLKIHFHTKTSELWCFLPGRVASLMLFERLRPQLGVGRPTRRTCSSSSSSGWGRRRRRRGRRKSGAGQWTLIFSSWSISATSAATRRRTVFWQRRRVPGQSPSTPPLIPSTLLSMKKGGGRGRGKGNFFLFTTNFYFLFTTNLLAGLHWAAQMILKSMKSWVEAPRRTCKLWMWGSSWPQVWWGRPMATLRGGRRRRWWGRGEMGEGWKNRFTIASE